MAAEVEPENQTRDRFAFERSLLAHGAQRVAGVDEVGRGPLAGPVVAAAAILPEAWIRGGMPKGLEDLNDSKQLTEAQRERFFAILTADASVSHAIAEAAPDVIDRLNILAATHRAMREALALLPMKPDHVLVDGLPVPRLGWPYTALVKGDARSYSIAAASVLAKVTRDRLMRALDVAYPVYGFGRHKGYATAEHLAALRDHGPSPVHRRSFAPVGASQLDLFGPA